MIMNKLIPKGLNAIAKGIRLLKQVSKNPFKSELNWSSKSWLGKRPVGSGGYTKQEEDILLKMIPELHKIELLSKENGTWLLTANGVWEGDPREWVMMQTDNYKKFMENSLLPNAISHDSNNWHGTLVVSGNPAISGKLFGDGFYVYNNPTGKPIRQGIIYTLKANTNNPPTRYTLSANALNVDKFSSANGDNYADMWISDRNDPRRVGTFHNPNYEGGNVRADNDALILDGAWKGKDKIILGYPDLQYASPNIKFVTGNTGEFNKNNNNVFRMIAWPAMISIPFLKNDDNE